MDKTDERFNIAGVDYFSIATCNIPESSLSVKGALGTFDINCFGYKLIVSQSSRMRFGAWEGGMSETGRGVCYGSRRVLHCLCNMHWLWSSVGHLLPDSDRQEAARYVPIIAAAASVF